MNEKVARWLFENEQERMDGEDWDSIQGRPLWEKVVKRYLAKADELCALMARPSEPVELKGVTAYQCINGDLYILTNANLVGAVHHFYRHFPEHAEQFGPLRLLTILSEGGSGE